MDEKLDKILGVLKGIERRLKWYANQEGMARIFDAASRAVAADVIQAVAVREAFELEEKVRKEWERRGYDDDES